MSTTELATRIGVTQSRISALERSEADGSLRLATLERAAQAIGCRLVYALVPDQPLEDMVRARARSKAATRLAAVAHSMVLENQSVTDPASAEQAEDLAASLVDKQGLWSDR